MAWETPLRVLYKDDAGWLVLFSPPAQLKMSPFGRVPMERRPAHPRSCTRLSSPPFGIHSDSSLFVFFFSDRSGPQFHLN